MGAGPDGVWSVAEGDNWVVASNSKSATDAVMSAAKNLNGGIVVTFC